MEIWIRVAGRVRPQQPGGRHALHRPQRGHRAASRIAGCPTLDPWSLMPALLDTTPECKEAVAAWRGIPDRPPAAYRSRSKGFQVLQNRLLERVICTSHWVMPGLWFLPIIGLCLWDGLHSSGLGASVVCMIIGSLLPSARFTEPAPRAT